MNLNQVTVPVTDLAPAVAFYERLGLVLIVHDPPDYARFLCPDGNATFSLHRAASLAPGERPVVYFECVDLDATVVALTGTGVRFDVQPTDRPWLWREAYLRDPDGNVVCLYYAGENRLYPPWRLPRVT